MGHSFVFLKNGSNLNRYWGDVFAPGYLSEKDNFDDKPIPEHAISFRKLIEKYWSHALVDMVAIAYSAEGIIKKKY